MDGRIGRLGTDRRFAAAEYYAGGILILPVVDWLTGASEQVVVVSQKHQPVHQLVQKLTIVGSNYRATEPFTSTTTITSGPYRRLV